MKCSIFRNKEKVISQLLLSTKLKLTGELKEKSTTMKVIRYKINNNYYWASSIA